MIKGSTKVGEIYYYQETTGKLEILPEFWGKAITGFGGGYDKMFVLEEGEGFEGAVSSLHPPENDLDRLFNENPKPIDPQADPTGKVTQERVMEFEDEGYQEQDHQESDQANQEEMEYINQMHENQRQIDYENNYGEQQYNEAFPQDPNIQEYQQMHQNEYDDDAQMRRTRGSRKTMTNDGDRVRTPGSRVEMGNTRTIQENMGHLKQIVASKNHILQLTRDGFVFSYGTGDFSVTGHGGSQAVLKPRILKHLSDKRVVQIACGENHSLILTDKNDVYSWGRGYEGQLGISDKIEIAAKPNYVKAFFGVPVTFIACGAFYSLAITHENKLYGWGEARLGQLGLGVKTRMVRTPTHIAVKESEDTVSSKNVSTVSVKGENPKLDTNEAKIFFCSAGLGHTTAISEEGELFVWGFNNWGQLGVGDTKTRWEPVRVERDILGNLLPQIQKSSCSYYGTYAIDAFGSLYSWGKSSIGNKQGTIEDLPRKVELHTENRYFTDVFCNKNMVGIYAPIRVYSISPNCGPVHGGTFLSIIGTGFVNSDRLKVRFTYGNLNQEADCTFDTSTKTLYCKTPKFEEFEGQKQSSLQLPCEWVISITTDGLNYTECEERFKIYSNKIHLNSVVPKSGSVKGGTELTLGLDLDPETANDLFHLTIGFQPKKRRTITQAGKREVQASMNRGQSVADSVNEDGGENKQKTLNASQHSSIRGGMANLPTSSEDVPVNPLDISPNNADLESDNWVCSAGYYENGKIICIVPALEEYQADNLQFNLDIALNGQQFSGRPLKFRYYDVNIEEVQPSLGPSEGGTNLKLFGTGLYDSPIKKIRFSTEKGCREVTATWDRRRRAIGCVVPPLTWIFGGEEVPEETIQEVLKTGVQVSLTFNNQEWISVPDYKYHDISVTRLAYVNNFAEDVESEEEKEKLWRSEEPIPEPPAEATEEEIKKWEEDRAKRIADEKEEVQTQAKRIDAKLYVYGTNFMKTQNLLLRFILGQKSVDVTPIYKNEEKLAWTIPDMGEEIEVGQHQVTVEASVNGQNFTSNGKYFMYNAIDRNMSEEELKKLQEAEEKAKAKGGKKK